MNFANYECLVHALLVCCAPIALVTVNGQSTSDTENGEVDRLINAVAELRAELTADLRDELKAEQVKSADRIAQLETALVRKMSSTFNTLILHSMHFARFF